jgi:hypothetical protein
MTNYAGYTEIPKRSFTPAECGLIVRAKLALYRDAWKPRDWTRRTNQAIDWCAENVPSMRYLRRRNSHFDDSSADARNIADNIQRALDVMSIDRAYPKDGSE